MRALVVGAGLSLTIGVGEPYGAHVIMGSHMSSLNAPAAFFLFFSPMIPMQKIGQFICFDIAFALLIAITLFSALLVADADVAGVVHAVGGRNGKLAHATVERLDLLWASCGEVEPATTVMAYARVGCAAEFREAGEQVL